MCLMNVYVSDLYMCCTYVLCEYANACLFVYCRCFFYCGHYYAMIITVLSVHVLIV